MKRIVAFAAVAALAGLPRAFAHETGSRTLGMVTAVTAASITVQTDDGAVVPVAVNDATIYWSDTEQATLRDIGMGARIAINVGGEAGSSNAKVVRVGAAQSREPTSTENDGGYTDLGTGGFLAWRRGVPVRFSAKRE